LTTRAGLQSLKTPTAWNRLPRPPAIFFRSRRTRPEFSSPPTAPGRPSMSRADPEVFPEIRRSSHALGGRHHGPSAWPSMRLEERYGYRLGVFPGDASIVLQLPTMWASDLFSLLDERNLEVPEERLENWAIFGGPFRNAPAARFFLRRRMNSACLFG